jgi:EAL domain-containing protein (putative c-di-GMP-specific phosphodiesterase class I)
VLLAGCPTDRARAVAEKIRSDVERFRFSWDDRVFRVGTSIGLVAISNTTRNLTELLSSADSACYVAKEGGRNAVHVYTEDDKAIAQQQGQMQWMQRIQRALDHDLFELYFQTIAPTKKKKNAKLSGEVLIRMVNDTKTENKRLISPRAFLPAAERYQLMPKIDRWTIAKTFSILSAQTKLNYSWDMCCINISGQSLGDTELLMFILDQFKCSKVPPTMICFEITESALIANLDKAEKFISTLKKNGCRFALDDVGSGLSAFSYLKTLPVDILKLDGELIKDVEKSKAGYAMVEALTRVAHVLEMKTVAEHVETVTVIAALQDMAVDFVQGFVVDRPQPFSIQSLSELRVS